MLYFHFLLSNSNFYYDFKILTFDQTVTTFVMETSQCYIEFIAYLLVVTSRFLFFCYTKLLYIHNHVNSNVSNDGLVTL